MTTFYKVSTSKPTLYTGTQQCSIDLPRVLRASILNLSIASTHGSSTVSRPMTAMAASSRARLCVCVRVYVIYVFVCEYVYSFFIHHYSIFLNLHSMYMYTYIRNYVYLVLYSIGEYLLPNYSSIHSHSSVVLLLPPSFPPSLLSSLPPSLPPLPQTCTCNNPSSVT